MKRYYNLYLQIHHPDNLWRAYKQAARGKRMQPAVAAFEYDLETQLVGLEEELRAQTYTPGGYYNFIIGVPKRRLISAAPFRDRVVHHALMNVIEPLFERQFIHDSYANRKRKGTHRALDRCTYFMRRYRYVMHCDVRQYFPSVDHAILRQILARTIGDAAVLALMDKILTSGVGVQAEEYTMVYFPGDDLFAVNRPRGLPIGNLTSQHWANVYLNELDYFVKPVLRCHAYARYTDDFVLFHDDKATLHAWRTEMIAFLETLRLRLHESRAAVFLTRHGFDFLGFRVFPYYRRLRKANARAFGRRLREMAERYAAGELTAEEIRERVRSWVAHARFGNTYRLRTRIFHRVIFSGGTHAELAAPREDVRSDRVAHSAHAKIPQEPAVCDGETCGGQHAESLRALDPR